MPMNNNKLIIAAAGSGKTTRLVNEALKIKDEKVLITTYTQANEEEIKKKIVEENYKHNKLACIPANITVQTWFSFLLKHGVRPFQGVLFDKKIKGMILVNEQSGVKYKFKKNGKEIPVYFKEETELEQHYFTKELKIYSDKLSKFVIRCNKITTGRVLHRLSRIYQHIFIDEVQDLAGYDLELLKQLFNCSSNIVLVGDPRQVVYLTHNERKYSKYAYGKIQEFIEKECRKDCCQVIFLSNSHRCNQVICDFSDKLYPSLPKTISENNCLTEHNGIFFVKKQDVKNYLQQYNATQLRDNRGVPINEKYKDNARNFGESKGLTFDRVLIYPTTPILEWLKDNRSELKPISRSKFYVAITRAKHSVGIVVDDEEKAIIEGITYFVG